MKVLIRQAKLEDLPRVVFITKLAYKTSYKPNTPITKAHQPADLKNKFLNKEFFALVAIIDNKIVGAIKYRVKDNSLYFYQLSVLKTYRNKGIGLFLINKVEEISKKKNCNKIQLDCLREKKLPDFYKKLGYKINKTKKHNNYHEVFMSKVVKEINL